MIDLLTYIMDYDVLPVVGFVEADYTFLVTEVLELLDITSEAESTNAALKAAAKLVYWERVVAKVAPKVTYSTQDESYNWSDLYAHALEMLKSSQQAITLYVTDTYKIDTSDVTFSPDPYVYNADREANL